MPASLICEPGRELSGCCQHLMQTRVALIVSSDREREHLRVRLHLECACDEAAIGVAQSLCSSLSDPSILGSVRLLALRVEREAEREERHHSRNSTADKGAEDRIVHGRDRRTARASDRGSSAPALPLVISPAAETGLCARR
jgi:hypothetical protein